MFQVKKYYDYSLGTNMIRTLDAWPLSAPSTIGPDWYHF